MPETLRSHDILPSEYFLVQTVTPKVSVVVGKISCLYILDQTLLATSYKYYYFANFNFNLNPLTTYFIIQRACSAWCLDSDEIACFPRQRA